MLNRDSNPVAQRRCFPPEVSLGSTPQSLIYTDSDTCSSIRPVMPLLMIMVKMKAITVA